MTRSLLADRLYILHIHSLAVTFLLCSWCWSCLSVFLWAWFCPEYVLLSFSLCEYLSCLERLDSEDVCVCVCVCLCCVSVCVSVHTVEFCVSMLTLCSLSLDLFLSSCLFLPPVSSGSLKNDCEHLTYSCNICMLAFLCLFSLSIAAWFFSPLYFLLYNHYYYGLIAVLQL